MARQQAPKNPAAPAKDPKKKSKPVKVRATRMGYYDHARRREGDVFVMDEADVERSSWVVRVPANTPESITTAQEAIDQAHDELLAGRAAQNTGGEGGI